MAESKPDLVLHLRGKAGEEVPPPPPGDPPRGQPPPPLPTAAMARAGRSPTDRGQAAMVNLMPALDEITEPTPKRTQAVPGEWTPNIRPRGQAAMAGIPPPPQPVAAPQLVEIDAKGYPAIAVEAGVKVYMKHRQHGGFELVAGRPEWQRCAWPDTVQQPWTDNEANATDSRSMPASSQMPAGLPAP